MGVPQALDEVGQRPRRNLLAKVAHLSILAFRPICYAHPMKAFRIAIACSTVIAALTAQTVAPPKTTLKVGDEANFEIEEVF